MLTGFYPNLGLGTNNLVAIHPPSIISDDIAQFLYFDRILVDGKSLEWNIGKAERHFFDTLIEVGFIEPKYDFYGDDDIQKGQALFVTMYQEVFEETIGKNEKIALLHPGTAFERDLGLIDVDNNGVRTAYYIFMKNYLAITASRRFGCVIVGVNGVDTALQLDINERFQDADRLAEGAILNGLQSAVSALTAVQGVEIEPFAICVTSQGAPVQPMCAFHQEIAPSQWPDWYQERGIAEIESDRRLQQFLGLRKAKKFRAFQAHLLGTLKIGRARSRAEARALLVRYQRDAVSHHEQAFSRLSSDFAKRFHRPIDAFDTLSPPERAGFWKEHPEHEWYGFVREDWMEMVSGKPTLAKLH